MVRGERLVIRPEVVFVDRVEDFVPKTEKIRKYKSASGPVRIRQLGPEGQTSGDLMVNSHLLHR